MMKIPRLSTTATVDVGRVKERTAARQDAKQLMELATEQVKGKTVHYCDAFWETLGGAVAENVNRQCCQLASQLAAKCQAATPSQSQSPPLDHDVTQALDQCNEIQSTISELPEAGFEFGESVSKRVTGIAETIEQTNRVTPKQRQALDNMQSGVEAWIHD